VNYIITGHRGLIGEFLKEELDHAGHKCILAIDKREGFDINDLPRLNEDYTGTDLMIHTAAQCRINEAIARPILPHRNNTDGIFEVLEFCRKNRIPKIIFLSSSRVLSPERNPYVASKLYGEELVKAYAECYGMKYIIIRPSTVYGPCFDVTSRMMTNFIVAALKGEDLRIYGKPDKTLDFTFVDDFLSGVLRAIGRTWNTEYNISGGEEKVYNVAKEIIKQTKSKSRIIFFAEEKAQPQKVKVDTSAIRAIGYNPKVSIKEGIAKTIKWFKEHPDAIENYKDKGREFYGYENSID